MEIPLVDLSAQHRKLERELKAGIEQVISSGKFILGPEVAELEKKLSEYCGTARALGVASGTDALLLSLKALGVKPGDEVITTPFTFYSTASTIVHAGARPVFADIEPETCLIRPDLVEEAITEKTAGIVPVHLFGQCADMEELNRLAAANGLFVLEDACQAIGASYRDRQAGSLGDAAALSFYPSKNLGGMGDGGMILTGRDDVAEKVSLLRVHGASRDYHHSVIGYNSRLDTIQAATLLAKLPYLDEWIENRRRNAERYQEWFHDSPVKPLTEKPDRRSVFNNYVIRAPGRDGLMEHLRKNGIGCAVYYPEPLHRMPCFRDFVKENADFPEAQRAAEEVLAIPAYPEMTPEMVDRVARAVLSFYDRPAAGGKT